ncbi:DUF3526 domain-containing protein [Marinoscillum furvescens]|uniref:ABC-2 type transport system permease protein n=1 Tax=Marinoscillum furvescens DSM 4134 TaxID=1122208 RepID=A0A3D9L6S4_MARFU|nr:DUF3526 domain-containing protein [Marinoscillum furvescens]REE02048.1 ABC-2 type transport system permease protein [Marinoscillum furvescens DSM 4134]
MNRATRKIIQYEWKVFIRNRFQLLMLGVLFLFGLYAIYHGQAEIIDQRDTINAVMKLEQSEFDAYKSSFTEELKTLEQEQTHDVASRPAYAWYRHGYHAVLPPHDFAALAIGQRDLYRYYYRLTAMSLYYQLFENELANPGNLLTGNFDLAFVLVYLFPLLIIAFGYGLYASDKEHGILALLKVQATSVHKVLLIRMLCYFTLVVGLGLLLSIIGLYTSGNPLQSQNWLPALVWLVCVIVYCAFWFGLLFAIVSFRKSSSFNAIAAVGCWLLFLIIVPAVLNVIVTTRYPLNSVALADLTRRTGLENEDDKEEALAVINEFLEHKPELAKSDSALEENLLPKAYAAFTSLKDIHHRQEVDAYYEGVIRRQQWAANYLWLSPAAYMQEVLVKVVDTDLGQFLHFQDQLVSFHQQISDFYFSRLFQNRPISREDYEQLPVFSMVQNGNKWFPIFKGIFTIACAAILVFSIGFVKFKKEECL